MPQLLDFSAALIDPQAIKDAGYAGVIGYMSPARPGSNFGAKPLPGEYCDALRTAGLEIVSCWQYGKPGGTVPSDWTTGYDGGQRMAIEAAAKHAAAGGPDTAPIYFAVDEDISLPQWNGTAFEFFRGVNSVIGIGRTGIYGHSRVCAWAAQDGVIGSAPGGKFWAWQTKAWSAGEIAPEAVLYQREIDQRTVGGIGVDVNDILAMNYGQWSRFTTSGGSVTAPNFVEINRVGGSSDARGGVDPIWFLLHTQEGNGTAESLAGYLNNSANGVSYHYTIDNSVTVVDVVDTDDASWSVLDANSRSINLCFAGSRAAWGPTQWIENMADAIDVAAFIAVRDCRRYGIPARIITPAQLGNYMPGIADHWAVTEGLGVGTHTDVGDGFPWDRFARAIDKYANQEEAIMSVADDELSKKFASRSKYRDSDEPIDTLAGFVLNIDARIHEEFVEREALKGVSWAVDLVKRQADAGDEGARAIFAKIQEGQK